MIVNFEGSIGSEAKEEINRYVKYSASQLMPEDILCDLVVNVIAGSGGCFDAYVEVHPDEMFESDPRMFNLHYDEQKIQDIDDLLLTMCHEMVHVKQFAMNELCEEEAARISWKGELYTMGTSKADYYNSPWEIEAYGKENGLYWGCTEYYQAIDKLLEIANEESSC